MVVNEWSPRFKKQYGGRFPRSYLCFDTEFTGNSQQSDLVMEIGHVIVEDNVVVDHGSFVLNWYAAKIDAGWLDYKLGSLRSVIGESWRLSPSFVKAKGHDPLSVLRFYHDLFDTWKKRDLPFVAQNGVWADEKMIRSNFNRFLNRNFELPSSGYFDTGVLFKANRVFEPDSPFKAYKNIVFPVAGESLRDYFIRIAGVKISGLKWNMSAILAFYGLTEKHAIDVGQLHGAAFDAMCVHHIMQHYRSLVVEETANETISVETAKSDTPVDPFSAKGLGELVEREIAEIEVDLQAKKVESLSPLPTISRPARNTPAVSPSQRRKQRLV
jgi:hypothetical protein